MSTPATQPLHLCPQDESRHKWIPEAQDWQFRESTIEWETEWGSHIPTLTRRDAATPTKEWGALVLSGRSLSSTTGKVVRFSLKWSSQNRLMCLKRELKYGGARNWGEGRQVGHKREGTRTRQRGSIYRLRTVQERADSTTLTGLMARHYPFWICHMLDRLCMPYSIDFLHACTHVSMNKGVYVNIYLYI